MCYLIDWRNCGHAGWYHTCGWYMRLKEIERGDAYMQSGARVRTQNSSPLVLHAIKQRYKLVDLSYMGTLCFPIHAHVLRGH